MAVKQPGAAYRWIALVVLALLVSACRVVEDDPNAQQATYAIAPQLREFYSTLGGQDTLGVAISLDFDYSGKQCQYFKNALLCYDPQAGENEHLLLYPLGRFLDLPEDSSGGLVPAGEQVVGDFPVSRYFQVMYDQLKGVRNTGYPMTAAHVDYDRGLIIQYFENVGFSAPLDNPTTVSLLPYGAYVCADKCGNQSTAMESFNPRGALGPEQPFLYLVTQMGGSEVGKALTQPYVADDGLIEQIYQTVVFAAPADRLDQFKLRPLPLLLNQKRTSPGPVRYGTEQEMTFYPIDGDLGFHVPLVFDAFVQANGGWGLAGAPIAEPLPLDDKIVRQCFTNYCLDYDTTQANGEMVHFAPLGEAYLSASNMEAILQTPYVVEPTQSASEVILQVSEGKAVISAPELQSISITVTDKESSEPRRDVVAVLHVWWSDGNEYSAEFPPTNDLGKAELVLPAKPKLKNGSIIPYEVCITLPDLPPKCVSNAYLIWNK